MSKAFVEDTNKLNINWLMKSGDHEVGNHYYNKIITWTTTGGWGESKNRIGYELNLSSKECSILKLSYISSNRYSEEKIDVEYEISLTTTPCYFGKYRFWFICPGKNCGKRVGVLYAGNPYFLCRDCVRLTYRERNSNKRFRDFAKLFNYEDKIEKLSDKIWGKYGRLFYKGNPTKRFRKYLHQCNLKKLYG